MSAKRVLLVLKGFGHQEWGSGRLKIHARRLVILYPFCWDIFLLFIVVIVVGVVVVAVEVDDRSLIQLFWATGQRYASH